MPVEVIRTIASVGSSMIGSGTLSTRTSRLPCQATAFMSVLLESRVRPVALPALAAANADGSGARGGPALGAGEDLAHHGALGGGVVVRGVPLLARERALGVFVEAAVGGVVAQPVAEQQARPRRLARICEDVDVDVVVRRPVHAVPGLADADGVTARLERRAV